MLVVRGILLGQALAGVKTDVHGRLACVKRMVCRHIAARIGARHKHLDPVSVLVTLYLGNNGRAGLERPRRKPQLRLCPNHLSGALTPLRSLYWLQHKRYARTHTHTPPPQSQARKYFNGNK